MIDPEVLITEFERGNYLDDSELIVLIKWIKDQISQIQLDKVNGKNTYLNRRALFGMYWHLSCIDEILTARRLQNKKS